MRNHNIILRQIAKDNLDPKVAYVTDNEGNLVPKFKEKNEQVATEENLNISIQPLTDNSFIVPEGARSIPEALEESVEVKIVASDTVASDTIDQENLSKKKTSLKKKKPVTATE